MVFDITTNTDLTSTIDRVIVEVTPIFQYKYVGLTNNAEAEMFHGFYLSYGQLTDSCVVPYPSKMEYNAGDSIKVRFRLEAGYPDLVSGNPVNLVLTDAESNSTVLKSSEEDSDGWLGAVIPEDAQTGDYTVTVVEPISGIAADSVYSIKVNANGVDGIDNPMAGEDVAGSYTVYTISGVKVAYGFGSVDFEALPKGIYMVKRNNAVTKVVNR